MRGETAGKPLKYAGNGDFQRGTEAQIINNLEMRMRRRRSALFHAHEAAQRRRRGEAHTYAEYKEAPETPI
jgi:hypothetical protein